jgi:hypothetical protein
VTRISYDLGSAELIPLLGISSLSACHSPSTNPQISKPTLSVSEAVCHWTVSSPAPVSSLTKALRVTGSELAVKT